MIENTFARLQPLLAQIERRRSIGFVDQVLQRQVAWTPSNRLRRWHALVLSNWDKSEDFRLFGDRLACHNSVAVWPDERATPNGAQCTSCRSPTVADALPRQVGI
jgi:hypothetical protein